VIPLQAWTGPDGSKRLRIQDFKTVGTWRWLGCQPYALAAFLLLLSYDTSDLIFSLLVRIL
jgi:hypothetical protein